MKVLLTLKAWQIFVLIMGLPIICQVVAINLLIGKANLQNIFLIFAISTCLSVATVFGWLFAMGNNLYQKLPVGVVMNLTAFKIAVFLPLSYLAGFAVWMGSLVTTALHAGKPNLSILFLIIPLHLLSMGCIFYCLYFNAKALKAVDLQRPVEFTDFIGEFFMIWFYPIGIWFIQPKLNKLFGRQLN